MKIIILLSVLPLLILGVLSSERLDAKEALPRQTNISLELAQKAAGAAVAQCLKDGYRVSAAVVDAGGTLKTLLRADGAGPHTTDSSRKKAYSSASLRRATGDFAELIGKNPGLQSLRDMNDDILLLGGGFPIRFGTEVVGGIGVGGAPGAHFDEACAKAGLEAIGAETE